MRHPLALGIALVLARPLIAQQTPEEVVAAYDHAVQTQDWHTVVDLLHPDALGEVHRRVVAMTDTAAAAPFNPRLWMAKVPPEFVFADAKVRDVNELRQLSPRTFVERVLIDSATPDSHEMFTAITGSTEVTVLGQVPEGTERVHVVRRYRSRRPVNAGAAEGPGGVETLTLRRVNEVWRIDDRMGPPFWVHLRFSSP